MDKLICSEIECTWRGLEKDALKAPNPFEPTEIIYGCPECKEINTLVRACDEPRCWVQVSCGTPTKDGYRSTCSKHKPAESD